MLCLDKQKAQSYDWPWFDPQCQTWVFFSAEETQTDDQHRFTIETITLVLPKVDF